jgi:hypothetical protein
MGPPYFATAQKIVRREKATMVSSLTTYNSLLIAAMLRPAPADKMAVLETRLLPGRESRIDSAFFLGSSEGTLEADRVDVREVNTGRVVRDTTTGRERAAVPKADLAKRDAMDQVEGG